MCNVSTWRHQTLSCSRLLSTVPSFCLPSLSLARENINQKCQCELCSAGQILMPRQSLLAGQIFPVIHAVSQSSCDLHSIVQHVSSILSVVDIGVLITLGWLLVPFLEIVIRVATNKVPLVSSDERKRGSTGRKTEEEGFERSYLFILIDHLSQSARLALLVYTFDCVVSTMSVQSSVFPHLANTTIK